MSSDHPDPTPDAPDEEPAYCSYTSYEVGEATDELPATGEGAMGLEADVWDALYGVEDPEMPISIVDLGLIYGVEVEEQAETGDDGAHVRVDMTLTYTGCPARDMLQRDVREAVESVEGVDSAEIRLVWSPEWNLEMVTEPGREDLREFGLSV